MDGFMDKNTMRKHIDSLVGAVTFTYNGKRCGVDPMSRSEIDLWYGMDTWTANSIDEVMNHPLFDGKSLCDILSDIREVEY